MSVSQSVDYELQASAAAQIAALTEENLQLKVQVLSLKTDLACALDELDWARSDLKRTEDELGRLQYEY